MCVCMMQGSGRTHGRERPGLGEGWRTDRDVGRDAGEQVVDADESDDVGMAGGRLGGRPLGDVYLRACLGFGV
jgi:hypothetical protein